MSLIILAAIIIYWRELNIKKDLKQIKKLANNYGSEEIIDIVVFGIFIVLVIYGFGFIGLMFK